MNIPLLIIGRPDSSKTTLLAQFYSKLRKNKSRIKLCERGAENIEPIIETRRNLAEGKESESTSSGTNSNLLLPIEFQGQTIELNCPDYGGEQIDVIMNQREVDKKWKKSIQESNHWIFLIRLTNLDSSFDLSSKNYKKKYSKESNDPQQSTYRMSDQSLLIELLQFFLFFKKNNFHLKNPQIKLTISLTCWDEIETGVTPRETLLKYAPLLLNFVESNWEKNKLKIIGLSAQGFSLTKQENKKKYLEEGSPEDYAYIIRESGERVEDITEFIIEALT